MKPESSLPCSQDPATGPYPEDDGTSRSCDLLVITKFSVPCQVTASTNIDLNLEAAHRHRVVTETHAKHFIQKLRVYDISPWKGPHA
jgi:hypothetical protein